MQRREILLSWQKKNIFMVLRLVSDRLRDTHDSFVAIVEKGLANEDANHLPKYISEATEAA